MGIDTSTDTQNESPKRICRKCLLRDMDQTEYFANLKDYIQRMDADLKVPDSVYEERLTICKECHYLNEGMCGACGCYVELRAVVRKNRCPYNKWGMMEAVDNQV